jgi:hypothetical protein
MDSRLDPLIATLSSLAKDREERDLIATTIAALEAKYDLSKKMAKEPGVEEIIKQLLGRIASAFGSLSNVKGNRILDIACGSTTSKAPPSIYVDTPFGETRISTADTGLYRPVRTVVLPGALAIGRLSRGG